MEIQQMRGNGRSFAQPRVMSNSMSANSQLKPGTFDTISASDM